MKNHLCQRVKQGFHRVLSSGHFSSVTVYDLPESFRSETVQVKQQPQLIQQVPQKDICLRLSDPLAAVVLIRAKRKSKST